MFSRTIFCPTGPATAPSFLTRRSASLSNRSRARLSSLLATAPLYPYVYQLGYGVTRA
jgi:hypothetical protein